MQIYFEVSLQENLLRLMHVNMLVNMLHVSEIFRY